MMYMGDVAECPHCGCEGTPYSTDEIEFSQYDGKGRYIVDCHCKYCEQYFRLYVDFDYHISRAVTSTGCGKDKKYKTVWESVKVKE